MSGNHRKLRGSLCALLLLSAAALTGCGSDDSAVALSESISGGLSRAEYIGMLGDSFGYDTYLSEEDIFPDVTLADDHYAEIQAAAEWEIIDRDGEFEPDETATLSFALESAVRAVGTDDIAASGAIIDTGSLADFYINNIAQIDLSDPEVSINIATAEQIIDYAKDYENNLVLPQITEMEFAEGVKTASVDMRLNADGATGVAAVEEGYEVGDIIYMDATDTSLARAIKITGVEGESFTFEEAPLEETYTYLNIQGSFEGNVVEAVSASDGANVGLGQEIYDEMKAYNMSAEDEEYVVTLLSNSAKVDAKGDRIMCTASFDVQKSEKSGKADTSASANGQLAIGIKNIRTDVKYESEWYNPLSPKVIECKLHFDTEISSEIHGSASASIPLGEAYIQVWGPLNIKVMLTAHLGADGNISVSYTTQNVLSVGWKKGTGLGKSYDSKADANLEADATLTAEATLSTDLRIGFKKASYSVTNAQITSGAVAVGKVESDLLGGQPTCLDLQLYVPLKWGVNQSGCLITDINSKWKHSATVWDSSNSPVKLHFHLEDWERTPGDVCTRTDPIEQELTTPEGEPLEEINPFDFEPIEFDFIELVSYTMYLGKGESLNIGFDSIPGGYTENDLQYEVLDPAVCTVSDGTVRGNEAGSTIVKISTGDGMFTVSLAVTVNEDYSVEGFQRL